MQPVNICDFVSAIFACRLTNSDIFYKEQRTTEILTRSIIILLVVLYYNEEAWDIVLAS
jgi:hypothetical protein